MYSMSPSEACSTTLKEKQSRTAKERKKKFLILQEKLRVFTLQKYPTMAGKKPQLFS